jgi:hypothetical protein
MATKTFTQFRVDNVVTTLPTTLQYGQEVYYKDASGNLTLWVGHEDGSAWPAVGYKEYVALLTQEGTNAPVATVLSNTLGAIVWSYVQIGFYNGTLSNAFTANKSNVMISPFGVNASAGTEVAVAFVASESVVSVGTLVSRDGEGVNDELGSTPIFIRVYP